MFENFKYGLLANEAEEAIQSWKDYARELEGRLELAHNRLRGYRAVRDELLKRLQEIDPSHPLLVKDVRMTFFAESVQNSRRTEGLPALTESEVREL